MIEIIISCEHGGNLVPEKYQMHFEEAREALESHKGLDMGILPVAKEISSFFHFKNRYSVISRLLVELNRSIDSPDLFSKYTSTLKKEEKEEILNLYYHPYRREVENIISDSINSGKKVVHLSFHSFTPTMDGVTRTCDIGLLFDPSRNFEFQVCESWKTALDNVVQKVVTRSNYPYLGTDDGFTTYLRTKFTDESYAGIELEVNQKNLLDSKGMDWITNIIKESLQSVMNQYSK